MNSPQANGVPGPSGGSCRTATASPRVVLASASPRRADILRQLGIDHDSCPAAVDESPIPGEAPDTHVERLARAKAEAVAGAVASGSNGPRGDKRAEPTLVIGGDTVVVLDGEILGKPRSEDQAVAMLSALAGREHVVFSGLAVVESQGPARTLRVASSVVASTVRFRAFDTGHASAYVATGEPMDKAGAYGVQRLGSALVSGMDGDFFAVMGMSVAALVELLERLGWRYEFGPIKRG